MTLNSDLDVNLFDERFIVFEIDKIKDDPVLFPIVVLIIMDVFLQKMRIKKGRKALIIEGVESDCLAHRGRVYKNIFTRRSASFTALQVLSLKNLTT